ncbi:MAG: hypothetical protein II954_03370 [Synergistaceae bacterium]|nr:hypothetical protein [Synergistaceae bacterium]
MRKVLALVLVLLLVPSVGMGAGNESLLGRLAKLGVDEEVLNAELAEPEAVKPEHFDGAQTFKAALTVDRPPMDYFSEAGDFNNREDADKEDILEDSPLVQK